MSTQKHLTILTFLLTFSIFPFFKVSAQQLSEKTGIRLYEHHSSAKTTMPFGNGADGSQSGYDFVKHAYVYSFDRDNFTAYNSASPIPDNIDMVEHNGFYGNGSNFGFTAGNSSIWAFDAPPFIRGNNKTKYILAPAGFNYETASNVTEIVLNFDSANAKTNVEAVQANQVYFAKIRGTNMYAAIKITEVKNANSAGGMKDVYFDFSYKYGTLNSTGIAESQLAQTISVFPNPSTSVINIAFEKYISYANISLVNNIGQEINKIALSNVNSATLNLDQLNAGIYFLRINDGQKIYTKQINIIK